MPSRSQKRARRFAPVIALTVALAAVVPPAAVAHAAAPTDSTSGGAAAGRAEGSGKLGYIGEYGTTNNSSIPAVGEFNHPYGIAVDPRDGMSLVVSDSGNVNWGSEARLSQQSGHSVQWIARAASYDPLRGNYRSGGSYDLSIPASEGFGGNFAFEHIAIQRTPTNQNYGPRGIAVAPNGEVFFTASQFGTAGGGLPGNSVRRLGLDGTETGRFGSWTNGLLSWPVGLAVDSTGLVFVTAEQGLFTNDNMGSVSVFAPDGTFVSRYPGDAIPMTLGVVVGESSSERVELWALSSAESGSRVVKLIAQKQGGQVDSRHNPAGWVWEVDASFDTGALGFKAFTMSGDLRRGELYVMPRTGTAMRINAQTGAQLGRIGSVGSRPGSYSLSRGAAADMSGFLHMTTENGYFGVPSRAVVQIFAETPSPVTGLTATPTSDSVALEWAPLPTGDDTPYGQAPLRAYVVEYRTAPDGAWQRLGEDASPSEPRIQATGLIPQQSYEFRVTPFNEAGSGDPAVIAATTTPLPLPGALSLTKQGDGKSASAEKPAQVAAGSTVEFSYVIANTGESPVTGLSLSDDKIGQITLKSELAPGESAVVRARGTVAAGPYTNVATVQGTTLGETVSASASWHAIGSLTAPPKPGTTPPVQHKLTQTGAGGPDAWLIVLPLLLLAAGGTAVVVGVRRHRREAPQEVGATGSRRHRR